MCTLGERLSDQEVDLLIAASDMDKTGYINYVAFVEMVHNSAASTGLIAP